MTTMQEKLLNVQRTNAWNVNSKLIEALGYMLPESLVEKIKLETGAVNKMVLYTYDQLCEHFPDATRGSSVYHIDDNRVMYLYYPDYENEKKGKEEKKQRVIRMKKRLCLLDNIFGIIPSDALKDFLYHLPLSTPISTFYTGNRRYVEAMSLYAGNTLYGNVEDDYCAVENGPVGRRVLTVFVKEITPELMEHQHQTMLMAKKLQEEHGVVASKELRHFMMALPIYPLECVNFDGSRERVENLMGDKFQDGDFVAVANVSYLTVYVREIDYVSELANRLVKCLQIDEETANFISSNLPHDRYYGQLERYTEFDEYLDEIEDSLRIQQGEILHDICQGDVTTADIQKDLPSAVLAGRNIKVFCPRV